MSRLAFVFPAALAAASVFGLYGCYSQPGGTDTETEGTGTTAPTSTDGTVPTTTEQPDGSGTGPASDCEGQPAGTPATSCPAEMPYCLDDGCVGCGALPVGTCATIDAANPACDTDSGVCVECTATDTSACGGATPACVDNLCSPCTADEQCESGICLVNSGECQAVSITLEGVVYAMDQVTPTPVTGADLTIQNIDPPLAFMDTPASGEYNIDDIPPGSLVDVSVDIEEDWAGDMNSAFRTVHQVTVGLSSPQVDDLEAVSYEWLGQVAIDCGLYDFGPAPTSWDVLCSPGADGVASPGCAAADEGVGSFILTRSTVVGTLYEEDGVTPYTDLMSRGALSIVMSNGGADTANVEANPGDTDPYPFHVCWLEESGGEYVGTTSQQNTSGKFVLFRLRNSTGLGQGNVYIEASGFDPGNVRLSSSGSVGVVSMTRNNKVIQRDFGVDVYPMFQEWGCLLCHSTGGIGAVNGERDGFFADWSLSPQAVYDNIVGPGTTCDTAVPLNDPNWGTDPGLSSGRLRVCTNAPEESLLIMRPTANIPRFNEVHPVDIFPGPDHPQMVIVREWVEQGANPPANLPVDFTTQIYPIFTNRGCVACHTACTSPMPGAGCKLDDATMTYWSDWNLAPNLVYDNLTGPGTNCADPQNDPLRVCVNAPESSLFVVRPLAGVPPGDPHPVEIFPSENDPDLQLIINWISQGASF